MTNEMMPEQQGQGAEMPMPKPPTPTFYALQAQAMVADLEGMLDAAQEAGGTSPIEAAHVLTEAATAAALLDVAHALRQVGSTLAQVLGQQKGGDGRRPSILVP